MRFAGFFIALGGIGFWITVPEYWEEFKTILNDIHISIIPIGLVSLVIIGGVVFLYDYRTRKPDNKDIYKKLYEELKDGLESLDGTLDRETQQHEIDGKKINYKHIYMNHKTFDSYVNSGEFNQIHDNSQQSLQDIYLKISIHDDLVKKIVDNGYAVDTDILTLNQNEKELKKEIPSMMENLRKYF